MYVFEGTIPSSIGVLTSMTYLNVGNNKLTGIFKIRINTLFAEVHFVLGTIPSSIDSMTNLVNFGLNDNCLNGKFMLGL